MEQILISHRGNLIGPNPKYENQPRYISKALQAGYEVEIDVWYTTMFWLGHNTPIYEVDPKFLQNSKLWCHAKNIEAVHMMKEFGNIHYFWHQEDDITLTSENHIWAFPGKQPIKNSIAVMPEIYNDDISLCKGICSDYITRYKK
jgi:hypothetical protein